MQNSKRLGTAVELHVMAHLSKLGFSLSQPQGDNDRWDIMVDNTPAALSGSGFSPKDPIKIQCKAGRVSEDGSSIRIDTCSSSIHHGGYKRDYRGEVDLIGGMGPRDRQSVLYTRRDRW